MKWLWRILVVVTAAAALTYFLYPRRYHLNARIWHWRHGNTTQLGHYVIPVPSDWFVTDVPSVPRGLELVDTGFASRPRPFLGNSSVFAFVLPGGEAEKIDLGPWRSRERQLLESRGIKAIEERTIQYGDETVVCIGGDMTVPMDATEPMSALVSVNCGSNGPLQFLFNGFKADLPGFYGLLAQIHKTNDEQ